jgi:hypothetical protein
MAVLFRNPEHGATTEPIYETHGWAYLGTRTQPQEDPVMLNRDKSQSRYLAGLVAALAVSILVVFASLTHAVGTMASYA